MSHCTVYHLALYCKGFKKLKEGKILNKSNKISTNTTQI